MVVGKRPPSFTEEPLILPAPVMHRWTAGRALYGVGTALTMVCGALAASGGITVAAGDTAIGNAISIAGSAGNIGSAAFLISGLALQHSALSMVGQDSGKAKFITGVIFSILGFASVASGYILQNVSIPDQNIVNYATAYGGTSLLFMGSSILIGDAANLKKTWERLGIKPAPLGAPIQP